jgi:cytochrome c551/c552
MKKSKLLAMALLSSAIALTSCQKKESLDNMAQPAPQIEIQQQKQQPTQQPQPQQATESKQEVKEEAKPQEQKPESQKKEKKQETPKPKEETKQQKEEDKHQASKVDGEAVFKSKGCVACHQPSTDSVGPALSKIASAYKGNKDGLVKFLNGEGKAIVDPAKEAIMKPNLETTKKLSVEEKEALAEFILKH